MSIDELKENVEKARASVSEADKILAVRQNKLMQARQALANSAALLQAGDIIEIDGGPFKTGVIIKVIPPAVGYEENMYGYDVLGVKKDGEIGNRPVAEHRVASMIARGTVKKIGEKAIPKGASVDNAS